MNKTLAFTAIALVAGIMMIGSFAPMAIADKGGVPNENASDKAKGKQNDNGAPSDEDRCEKAQAKAEKFTEAGKDVPKGIQKQIERYCPE